MEELIERLRDRAVSKHVWGIRDCLLNLIAELKSIGVPLNAIEISNWPEFDKDDIYIKIWDGNNHIKGTGKPDGIHMTPGDIIALVKRRQILMRKF